ncbi:MAG: response regulator [Flavobacteriaceae bacterium]
MAVHIIEDDCGVADSLRMFFADHRGDVSVYRDAESFMAAAVPGADDLIIVDLALPGMKGGQLIRWLNGLKEQPRVVVVTGESEKRILDHMKGLKVAGLIRKPIETASLDPFLD